MLAAPTHRVVQIIPCGVGGVRDCAMALHEAWQVAGFDCRVLPLVRLDTSPTSLADWSTGASVSALDSTVVLHFSGYGYARRGLCGWLVRAVRRWRRELSPPPRIVVVFHELFASGPPWRSAFWLSGVQERIAQELAVLADACWTSTAAHAQWLTTHGAAGKPMHVAPVFSNIPDRRAAAPWAERSNRLIVFGGEASRRRALDALQRSALARQLLPALGIDELIEVGAGHAGRRAGGIRHEFAGHLEPTAISALLQGSRFGLIAYPRHLLAKSSVFAAYAAHGCAPINLELSGDDADGLRAGSHFVCAHSFETLRRNPQDAQAIGARLRAWYAPHRLSIQAAALAALGAMEVGH